MTPTSTSTVTVGGTGGRRFDLGIGSHDPDRDGGDPELDPRHAADQLQRLLTQIDQLAGNSSYNGVNLLNGDNLTVNFNENGTSGLTIAGVNFNSSGTWLVDGRRQRVPGQ